MCIRHNTPLEYKHQNLMDELNNLMASVKVWLHCDQETINKVKSRYPKPTPEKINEIQQRINQVLQQDATPFVKH